MQPCVKALYPTTYFDADCAISADLRLVDSKTSATGLIIVTFERAGEVNQGSFVLGQPSDAAVERRCQLAEEQEDNLA